MRRSARRTGRARAVEVVASGGPEILQAMADRVRSLESRYPVAVRWTAVAAIDVREVVAPRAAGEAVFARVWLDMSDPARAVLFIANAGHDRFLVRVVPVSDGYGELTRESLATVVESAIDALLAGGQIGVDRGEAVREIEAQTGTPIAGEPKAPESASLRSRPPVPAAPQPPSSSKRRPWSLAAQYRADAMAAGPTVRHGAQLALGYATGLGSAVDLLLMLTAQFTSRVLTRRRRPPRGRCSAAARGLPSARLRTCGACSAGRRRSARAPISRGSSPRSTAGTGLVGAEPFLVASPVATVFVSGVVRPAPWLDLALGVGVDVAVLDQHFDVETAGDRTPLISPWRARPYAFVGAGVPFGEGAER